jgi:NAD(P)-dependent dehydrogenase (short-subunit alcohol dehydrogenase family)
MKTVVITGSSRGLGWELAQRFRKAGLNVVLNGVSSERLEKSKAGIGGYAG